MSSKHKDNLSISDCIAADKEFCFDKYFLWKSSHKYYVQVQMHMYIYGLKACHFVIWTPMFCTGVSVPYDDSLTKKVPVLVEFHKKHLARELRTRAIENTQGEETNSICQTPCGDSKPCVGCDDVHCNYKCIHFTCAKVKKTKEKSKRNINSKVDKPLGS